MVNWAKYPSNQLHINCFVLWKYRQNLLIYLKNANFFHAQETYVCNNPSYGACKWVLPGSIVRVDLVNGDKQDLWELSWGLPQHSMAMLGGAACGSLALALCPVDYIWVFQPQVLAIGFSVTQTILTVETDTAYWIFLRREVLFYFSSHFPNSFVQYSSHIDSFSPHIMPCLTVVFHWKAI